MNRRAFLMGASASVVAAAVPVPPLTVARMVEMKAALDVYPTVFVSRAMLDAIDDAFLYGRGIIQHNHNFGSKRIAPTEIFFDGKDLSLTPRASSLSPLAWINEAPDSWSVQANMPVPTRPVGGLMAKMPEGRDLGDGIFDLGAKRMKMMRAAALK